MVRCMYYEHSNRNREIELHLHRTQYHKATCFSSTEFEEFMTNNGIKHNISFPYHPATNGQPERTVKSFKESLKKSRRAIQRHVYIDNFCNITHTTTEVSPAKLLNKRKLATRLSKIVHITRESQREVRSTCKSQCFQGRFSLGTLFQWSEEMTPKTGQDQSQYIWNCLMNRQSDDISTMCRNVPPIVGNGKKNPQWTQRVNLKLQNKYQGVCDTRSNCQPFNKQQHSPTRTLTAF